MIGMRADWIRLLGMSLPAVALASCGAGSVQLSGSLPVEDKLQGASLQFSTTLYPLVMDHCSSCHSETQAPLFAVKNDALSSYNNLVQGLYVDTDSPENSKIVTKVAANHNCWSGSCANDAKAITDKIKSWVSLIPTPGPDAGGPSDLPSILTALQTIPSAGGTTTGAIVTFSLAGLGTGLPSDASAQVTLKQLDSTTYSISKLQIKSSIALGMANLAVVINGKEIPNDTFQFVDYTQTPFVSNNLYRDVSPATVFATFGYNGGGGPGSDKIQIGFRSLLNFDPAKLRFINFLSVVQNSCGGCHMRAYGATPAFGGFTTEAQFLNVPSAGGKKLLVPRDTANSTIYTYSAPGTPNAMPKSGIQPAIYNTFATYINGL